MRKVHFLGPLCALIVLRSAGGLAQTALPAAPVPQQGTLKLPPGAVILAQPHSPPPPVTAEDEFCTAPSDQANPVWDANDLLTDDQRAEVKEFVPVMIRQMSYEWLHHIPELATSQFSKGRSVLIRFDLLPDGTVNEMAVMMSSGRKSYDKHAVNTIQRSAPFPVPGDIQMPLHFCMLFQYNVNRPKPLVPDPLEPYALPRPKSHHP